MEDDVSDELGFKPQDLLRQVETEVRQGRLPKETSSDRNARARADRSSTGPVVWHIARATFGTSELSDLQRLGWEPFSVDGQLVYFRKQTLAASP
jgi:hypothetical protein